MWSISKACACWLSARVILGGWTPKPLDAALLTRMADPAEQPSALPLSDRDCCLRCISAVAANEMGRARKNAIRGAVIRYRAVVSGKSRGAVLINGC